MADPIGIFQGRKTWIQFRNYLPSVIQPWSANYRDSSEMAHSSIAQLNNVVYLPKVGWRLQSYHLSAGDAAWYSAAQPGILSPGAGLATMAPNHYEFASFAQQSATGLTYSSDVQSSGTPMITKRIPTGDDITGSVLTADQTSFPSANTSEDQTPLYRVFIAPNIEPWDNITWQVLAPASALQPRGFFAGLFFSAPAGYDTAAANDPVQPSVLAGTGQYELKLRGDGRAFVYELLNNAEPDAFPPTTGTWKPRFSFMWNTDPLPVSQTLISITITQSCWQDANGNFYGDGITFTQDSFGITPNAFSLIELMADMATLDARLQKQKVPFYNIPRVGYQPAATLGSVRIDIAADCKASFQAAKHVYQPSGSLLDDFISFDQPLTTDNPVYVYINGVLPYKEAFGDDTAWTINLYDENGTTLTTAVAPVTYNTTKGQTTVQAFVPTVGQRYAQVQVSSTSSSDQFRTPTLISHEVYRSPLYSYTNPLTPVYSPARSTELPALPENVIVSWSVHPQEADPGAEMATAVIEDFTGELAFLGEQGFIPCQIIQEIEDGTMCPIFSGNVLTPNGDIRRSDGSAGYPVQGSWVRWTLTLVGQWARTALGLLPKRKPWVDVPPLSTAGQPSKITDNIRFAWETIYPPEMVQVPDLDIRLFTDDAEAYVSEPGTKIIEFTSEMSRDYLGAYPLFDESAGDYGMLRLLQQKTAPYNNLAVFELDHPTVIAGDEMPRIPQWAAAYPTTTSGLQQIQHIFIQAGTFGSSLERAEGNHVQVTGGSAGSNVAGGGGSDGTLSTQTMIKTDSYNAFNLSPSNANYPNGTSPEYYGFEVPIFCTDFKLQTAAAIAWKIRRIFEKACYTRFYLSFMAPMLLVTDTTDSYQRTPRRLRFYDPVMVRQLSRITPYWQRSGSRTQTRRRVG